MISDDEVHFTLTETVADTETETDKVVTVSNGIGASVQCEHLHTILFKPFYRSRYRSLLV